MALEAITETKFPAAFGRTNGYYIHSFKRLCLGLADLRNTLRNTARNENEEKTRIVVMGTIAKTNLHRQN